MISFKNLPLQNLQVNFIQTWPKWLIRVINLRWLNTFKRLKIANSFLFLIFPVCYLYVMSQSTFHDQIRLHPLIACLICAAWEHSRTKKLREESRKKRIIIIIRNRVKTICSQTSFGEHNKKQSKNNMFPNFVWGT